jgi:hypothetical protein
MMNTLSEYMAAAGNRLLPGEVAEHAKHHLLDTLASMISGSELPAGQAAERYIRVHGGKGTATIAGATLTAAPVDAALANGVMPMRMKPTIRTTHPARIRARSCRRHSQSLRSSASTAAVCFVR